MFRWNRRLTIALACVMVFTAAACRRDRNDGGAAGPSILRISQRNEPATLDPHLATLPDEFFILRAISEGLVTPNPDGGTPLPGVAERWETSADSLQWIFHLRSNARWSTGDPVAAGDFVFSARRALSPQLGAPKARLFYPLRNAEKFHRGTLPDFAEVGISARDARTLVLQLESPTPHLLALLASGPWLPLHRTSVERSGAATSREGAWTRPGNYVGNGPFTLTEWIPDQHLAVVPNPHYWQRTRVKVGGIRFQIFDNGDTEERAFRAGQIEITMAVPAAKLGTYSAPVLRRQPLHETRYLALNTQRPQLADRRARAALGQSIDRTGLVETVTKGGQLPALNFLPPGLGRYRTNARLSHDVAEAQRLATAAGLDTASAAKPLEFSAWGVSPVVLEAIQQMWTRSIGVQTEIVQREGRVHLAALAAGNFDVAFTPAIPDFDDPLALLGEFVTEAPGNYPHWTHAEYDRVVAEAARTVDDATRTALYRQAEDILMTELPVIPLYFNTQNYLVSPRVRGWRQDALWNRYYLDVSIE